jgi:lipopolysaccharide export system permease protein
MTILDRLFFISFIRSYLIVLTSLLSLYIVVDLFTNLNDFTNNKSGLISVAQHILGYYSVQITQIFDLLSEAITLIAAVFAVSWMMRNNELLPQLSAGVSTRRAVRPILFGAMLSVFLTPVNTELIVPMIADRLNVPRDDPELVKPAQVRSGFEVNSKEHITGQLAFRRELRVVNFEYTSNIEGDLIHLLAAEAVYVPEGQTRDGQSGGWLLFKTTPETLEGTAPQNVKMIMPGRFFIKSRELDFDSVTRRPTWYLYAATPELWQMLGRPDTGRQSSVAVLFHSRLTRPLLAMILVVLGLGVILRDQQRHVFISTGLCLIMGTCFYLVVLGCKFMGNQEILPATLAAWLPVMIFGPVAVSLFDGVHT